MGLRSRLALFFMAITVVPLTLALFGFEVQTTRLLREHSTTGLWQASQSASALVEATRQRADDLAVDLARRGGDTFLRAAAPGAAQSWLDGQDLDGRADVVVIAAADGGVVAARADVPPPEGVEPGQAVAQIALAAVGGGPPPAGATLAVPEVVAAPGEPLGRIAAGAWLDGELLTQVVQAPGPDSGAAFVAGGAVLAATGPLPADHADLMARDPAAPSAQELPDARVASQDVPGSGAALVLWAPSDDYGLAPTVALLVAAVLAAGVLGWLLAGGFVAPVRRAAAAARAVAGGDLSRSLAPTGGRELADLADALNVMSAELGARLAEIERSRDELRLSVGRLGETLSSSLDLDRMLPLVVDTARDMVRADGAVLLLRHPDGTESMVERGATPQGLATARDVDERVVRSGQAARVPAGGAVPGGPGSGRPAGPRALGAPLRVRERAIGTLVLLRDETSEGFSDDDVEMLRSIAAGTAVAVENIRLHEEAERLSVTDPLTELWNRRYFELLADREIVSADRFQRPVSFLMLDLDHFREVNNRYGHPVGDVVLVELARRLDEATPRAVDVVARVGGEEFAVILPDTDYDGAAVAAERIREAVAGAPMPVPAAVTGDGPLALPVTCSIGMATFPDHARDRTALYRAANGAMREAKSRGRNQVVGASELLEGDGHAG